ncbi:PAQR family membrane homeostasis protein TrhA [Tundrisphaera sp. TA3]|uniref:PAQR family membrane homeostasis protein TrhA n=1 Tax=Tundrisphaera sp. TA3 TaxID=3435775 RepID=UPI003EBB2EA6
MEFLVAREPASTWTHFLGMLIAWPGTVLLWRRVGDDLGKRVSLLVYGVSLIVCYAASSLYHGLRVSTAGIEDLERLDRIGIFVLIAGTYTPLAWNLLSGRWRWGTLAVAWLIAAAASLQLALGGGLSPWIATGLYLAMGWGSLLCCAEIARVLPLRDLRPLVVGGLFYSVGAVLNVLHWPALWPGTFGTHDLFHLFVMAGSLAHFRLMLLVVVPFDRQDPDATRARGEKATTLGALPAPRTR